MLVLAEAASARDQRPAGMNARRLASRAAAYAWAAPATALGAAAGLVVLCLGGRVRFVSGTAEFHGAAVARVLAGRRGTRPCGALTLGHVVLGTSPAWLSVLRAHERVHVRQYERWGLFFLPAYALSSLWQLARGRHWYRDNFFERRAYAAGGARRRLRPAPSR
ncbi:MAG: signal peptide prediction [Deltaproteobacteria bacterium]